MDTGEKNPLPSATDEKARRALKDLSSSLGAHDDVESAFLLHRGGRVQDARPHHLLAQLRSNWWLWSTVAFAVCLIGGLTLFRNSLYDSGAHGLPFLAVKDNAAEACTLACREGGPGAAAAAPGAEGEPPSARAQDAFDACYSKCVVAETREVAEEREAFKRTEEEYARDEEKGEDEKKHKAEKKGKKKHKDDDHDHDHDAHKQDGDDDGF
ncbi:hypothetical protein WJX81_008084 [Elliptochloris bilobata]|uniref:Uncharacterized protein n=1 Tax=Elliptochloris bilobata TaxID=381761 RepID=A0AAW1RTI5_9CHLO